MHASHQQQHSKRRKKRISHATKTVTVVRGKQGYGFTISGQNPCMLSSIVPGSPAEVAGLKPGDLLHFVNRISVGRTPHDDVVRMVGLSTGSLELQVSENCNASDSSDDDYPPRSKSRYPNRIRPRQGQGNSKLDLKRNGLGPVTEANKNDSDLSFSPASTDDTGWSKRDARTLKGRTDDDESKENVGFAFTSVQKGPIVSTAKISSAAAVVKKVPPVSQMSRHSSAPPSYQEVVQALPAERGGLDGHSAARLPSRLALEAQAEEEEILPVVADSLTTVVGYIGSIETHASHTRPHQRLQALRSAVRRLRVEKRVHTLVMMKVESSGVSLTSILGKELAAYPRDRIAFSGICPDDHRFFGLVTLGIPDDSSSQVEDDSLNEVSSSCHIFMIEPELSSHSAHVQQAELFKIKCTTDPQTHRCEEFPVTATSLILCIANLYRDGPPKQFDNEIIQSNALADPVRHQGRNHSNNSSLGNNSTSDSGLGFFREDAPLEQNEQVLVVDMPDSSAGTAYMDSSGMSVTHNLSSDWNPMGTPRPPNSTQRPLSAFAARRGLNNSTSSEECWQASKRAFNKLTPRAMPDPSLRASSNSVENLSPSVETLDNMRESMQRLLQARQVQLQEQNRLLDSDGESQVENPPILSLSLAADGHTVLEGANHQQHIFAVPTEPPPLSSRQQAASGSAVRSAFQVPRPVSAPLGGMKSRSFCRPETVDMNMMEKLSPRAFPHTSPTSSAFRSPSAPPAPFFPHRESDEDDDDDDDGDDGEESEDDPYIKKILHQFRQDRFSQQPDDTRRFSEGFAILKKREKEQYEAGNLQKWTTKATSVGRSQHALLKQSFSQSHESLAVPDDAPSSHQLTTANSVNNVAHQAGLEPRTSKAGRVAGWAVNFERLLKDPIGLAIFTEFLKKEFSEENIIFWKACEQYRQLEDDHTRKYQAQDIYDRHLSPKASDPVNVDSAVKSHTEKFLDNPTAAMFDFAQQHIFQLMRQDSYARFLKSDLYKDHVVQEMEGRPLHNPTIDGLAANLAQSGGKGDKKKGKGKENEEKRRRSILPWKQSKKSSLKKSSDSDLKKLSKKSNTNEDKTKDKEQQIGESTKNHIHHQLHQYQQQQEDIDRSPVTITTTNTSTGTSTNINVLPLPVDTVNASLGNGAATKPLGPGINLSTMRKEVFPPRESHEITESQFKFCRIMLPDGSTTVVCAKPGQTCRNILSKLCEKRSVSLASVDFVILGSNKPLDLDDDISTLGSKEIIIEKRVLFRLDLPNSKCIGVKAKPNRTANDVFEPILLKYGFNIENVTIHLHGEQEALDLEQPVSNLDNERVAISTTDDTSASASAQGLLAGPRPHKAAPAGKSRGSRNGGGVGSLEEITNQIFEDLMRGKSQLAHGFDELGVMELDKAKANHKNGGGRSLGLLGLLRRESLGAKDKSKKSKGKVTFALPKTETKKNKEKDGQHLMELLSGAQNLRLEDKKGLEVATGDAPSFLYHESSRDVPNRVVEVHLDQEEEPKNGTTGIFHEPDHRSRNVKKGRPVEGWMVPNSSSTTPRMSSATTPRGRKGITSYTTAIPEKERVQHNCSQAEVSMDKPLRMSPVVVDMYRMAKSMDNAPHYDSKKSHQQKSLSNFEHASPRTSPAAGLVDPVTSPRPLNSSSSHFVKAPVVSPERSSPQTKKPRGSVEPDFRGATISTLLPNKISPTPSPSQPQISKVSPIPSSSQSHPNKLSLASNTCQGHSNKVSPPSNFSQPHPSKIPPSPNSPQPHPRMPLSSNVQRIHSSPVSNSLMSHLKDASHPSNALVYHQLWNDRSNNYESAEHATRPYSPRTSPHQETPTVLQQSDLAQRALLSPRANSSPQNLSPSPIDGLARTSIQNALLSPRLSPSRSPFGFSYNPNTYDTNSYNNGKQPFPLGVSKKASQMYNNKFPNPDWESQRNFSPYSSQGTPRLSPTTESLKQRLANIFDSGEETVTFV